MKKISAVMAMGILLVLTITKVYPQHAIDRKIKVIEPYHLEISYFKTSNLVFPYSIISVDRGSKDVLVQQAKGVENILQVKAGKQDFEETNLTVITASGHMYSYILNYSENPSPLNLQYVAHPSHPSKKPQVIFSAGFTNEAEMQAAAARIIDKKRIKLGIKDTKNKIQLRLNGLFIWNDIMYYQLQLKNDSNINYDIGQFRFFISDQRKSKRTAIQELEIKPLYVHQDTTTVIGKTAHTFIFALPKFTIPDNKQLIIQLMEKNGGRQLELKVNNRAIVRSKPLSDQR